MKKPWAIILCKFSDGNDEPFPMKYYHDLFTKDDQGSKWNMVRYFHDCSQGNADVSGSKVFGWFHLNKSVADYNALGGAARGKLIEWARAAAKAAGVDLKPFFNTVVCTNLWHDIGETGTGVVAQGTTAIPSLLGHEMGHGFGLQHSRLDGSNQDYQDPWDIMSAANDYTAADSEFTTIGPGMNAANMRSLHWLDEARVWKGATGGYDETLKIRPLLRHDLPGWLAADFNGFLVEFRVKEGWDGGIPRPCVLVHQFLDGHSYLMRGNSGSEDLLTDDSFGDPDPGGNAAFSNPFTSFQRVDVLAIDANAREATLRMRYRAARQIPRAIDPMAMILSDAMYAIWAEAHHPHVPDVAAVQKLLQKMSPAELQTTVARAQAVAGYGNAIIEAAQALKSKVAQKASG